VALRPDQLGFLAYFAFRPWPKIGELAMAPEAVAASHIRWLPATRWVEEVARAAPTSGEDWLTRPWITTAMVVRLRRHR
jgi:hypothetical protein